MFLSALQTYVTVILIAVIIVQYAFATFCLLKLAYLDIDKKQYVLWNLFVLIVFFIGGIVFLVYFYKHPEKRIRLDAANPTSAVEQDLPDENESADAAKTSDAPSEPESDTDPESSI